jgi:hypothetical protein
MNIFIVSGHRATLRNFCYDLYEINCKLLYTFFLCNLPGPDSKRHQVDKLWGLMPPRNPGQSAYQLSKKGRKKDTYSSLPPSRTHIKEAKDAAQMFAAFLFSPELKNKCQFYTSFQIQRTVLPTKFLVKF